MKEKFKRLENRTGQELFFIEYFLWYKQDHQISFTIVAKTKVLRYKTEFNFHIMKIWVFILKFS